jgi:hypothetical protein
MRRALHLVLHWQVPAAALALRPSAEVERISIGLWYALTCVTGARVGIVEAPPVGTDHRESELAPATKESSVREFRRGLRADDRD